MLPEVIGIDIEEIRILHVDDAPNQFEFIKFFLNQVDGALNVTCVDTPEKVFKELETDKYDCLVTDFQMPLMNGIELSRKIRESYAIPIILYTGQGSEGFAKGFIVITAILGLILSYTINMTTLALSATYWVMFTLYSYPGIGFKKMFIVKELTIKIAWPVLALAGVYAVTNEFSFTGIFAGLMMGMFSFLGMPALSDSFDAKEDIMYGVKTMAQALTWKRRVELLGLALFLMMGITAVT